MLYFGRLTAQKHQPHNKFTMAQYFTSNGKCIPQSSGVDVRVYLPTNARKAGLVSKPM